MALRDNHRLSYKFCSDINFSILLTEASEIPWGPSLFYLSINNFKFKDRFFLKNVVSSTPDHCHALTEYIYLNRNSYYTQLFIIDCQSQNFATYGRIKNAFITPKTIEVEKIIFNRQVNAGVIEEYELPLNKLTWLPVQQLAIHQDFKKY